MRNRRKPPGGIEGEILPPSASVQPRRAVDVYRQPVTPKLEEFSGIFNVVGRLRAWGQQKGYVALAETLDKYDDALRAQIKVAEAIESLELQEERLHPLNLEILKEAARRDIDTTLASAQGRMQDVEMRNRQAQLRGAIAEEKLQRDLIRAQRAREKEEDRDDRQAQQTEKKQGKSIEEQLAELHAKLFAAQEKIEDDNLNEAEVVVLQQEISFCLSEMERLNTERRI